MNENKKNRGLIVLVVILVLALVATSGYIVYDKFIAKEEVEEKNEDNKKGKDVKEKLEVTDVSFSNTLEALSKYTYEQNREDGYHSFTAQELLEIVAKDLVNSDFEYIGEEAISGWNRKVYQLSYQTLIDKLKQYFSSDVEFTPSDIVNGQGAVLPNVNFGDGSGMAISSYDNTTGTYQVYFGGVGGTSGPKPQINERKVMDAYRLGDKIYVTEKAIYYTSSSSDYTNFIYNIYSHPNQNDLVDTLNFQGDTISSQSISVDSYLDRAATISYVFSKDNNQYVFSSSKIS